MSGPTPAIGEELPAFERGGFTQLQVLRYAEASGDRNPIHTDLAMARLADCANCVVHGMLVVGQFEEVVRRWRGDGWLVSTTTRFVNPLLVDEPLTIAGRVVAQSATEPFDFVVRLVARGSGNRIICLSDGQVRFGAKE